MNDSWPVNHIFPYFEPFGGFQAGLSLFLGQDKNDPQMFRLAKPSVSLCGKARGSEEEGRQKEKDVKCVFKRTL